MTITEQLAALSDADYARFTAKLTPGIDPATLLGCRIPQLRQLARRLRGSSEAAAFLAELPHRSYDENNLHGLLLGQIRDPQQALTALGRFLPHIDNWATCDITAGSMKALGRNPELVIPYVERWLDETHTYTVRFGIVTLLGHYLDERFDPRHLALVAAVQSDEYYINMARAWYFSMALVKHYDSTLPWLTERRLDRWTHNKSLQKARESLRIDATHKTMLQQLKY